jgi:hypothetical protein
MNDLQAADRPRIVLGGSIGLIVWVILSSVGIVGDLR